MSAQPKQILIIDLVRFAAALAVVLFHIGYVIAVVRDNPLGGVAWGAVTTPMWPAIGKYGWVGVEVFFVISGIVISYSSLRPDAYGFFKSRFLRLVPVAWLCSTLTLVVLATHRGQIHGLITAYLHSMLFIPWMPWIDGSFWTLGVEISFYLMVGVLIARRNIKALGTCASALAWLGLLYWLIASVAQLLQWEGASKIVLRSDGLGRVAELLLLKHGSYFALGVFISRVYIEGASRPSAATVAAMMAGSLLQIYWATLASGERLHAEVNPMVPIALWLGAVAIIVLGIVRNDVIGQVPLVTRMLRSAGLMTYPLYLLHMMIGGVLIFRLVGLGVGPRLAQLAAFFALLLLSWLIVTYLEPPLRRLTGERMERVRIAVARKKPVLPAVP